jgi:ABC-type Fe3+ transport system substrate-binding protein
MLLGLAAMAAAEDLGKVNIPSKVTLKGQAIGPGAFTVALEKKGGDLMIVLKKDGAAVASELAITKPADKHHDKARLAYQTLKQDGKSDPLKSRILVSYQGTYYLLYFED